MAIMTDEEWQNLHDNFETTNFAKSVKAIDSIRRALADNERGEPPELRDDLQNLHQLAMEVVNQGQKDKASQMFDLAGDLDMQVSDLIEALEIVQTTINNLLDLYPESLSYIDD